MQAALLEKAVTHDLDNTLLPVLEASYDVEPKPSLEIVQIADKVNKKLGYPLFEDLHYPQLVLDFSRVTRAVSINAMRNK